MTIYLALKVKKNLLLHVATFLQFIDKNKIYLNDVK